MPNITSAPRPHSMIQLEAVRQELAEAAELAADANGKIDTSRVAPGLRDAFEKIGGGSALTAASFHQKLERAMDALDRADTGGSGDGHYFGYQGSTHIEDGASARREATRASTPILTRIFARLSGGNNFAVDVEERKAIADNPGALAVLAKADSHEATKSEALAKKHFTGPQVLHRDYFKRDPTLADHTRGNVRPEGHFGGGAGALKDIATVMVKHHDTGEWSQARVDNDGSFKVPLGEKTGEMSVWYETKSGETFFGGNILMFSNTHTDSVRRAVAIGTPDDMERPPLSFAE